MNSLLLQLGILLFLIGLLNGFVILKLANLRMVLANHLEEVCWRTDLWLAGSLSSFVTGF
jgi:hypothetical protein